jgi:hypothetical protein
MLYPVKDITIALLYHKFSKAHIAKLGVSRQLAEKWGLVETKTTSNANPKRKGMIESMLDAYKHAHPDEQSKVLEKNNKYT